jgi:hypothetical protein
VAVVAVDWLSGGAAVVGKRVGTAVDSIRWAEVSKETSCWAKERFSTVQCTMYNVPCGKNNNTAISEVRKCRFSCTLVGEDAA